MTGVRATGDSGRRIVSFDARNQESDIQRRKADLSDHSRHRLWGVFIQRKRWGLSWRGRLLSTLICAMTLGVIGLRSYPFLSVTHRVTADTLVVEGWVHEYAIHASAEEFKTGSYKRIFTTGGPVIGMGGYVNDYQTAASVGAEGLKKAGLAADDVQMVPSHVNGRDRTYSSAVALREWLGKNNVTVNSFNVLTEDTHARRTRLLFQEAFGDQVEVGIISVSNPDYDANRWWRYSEGVKGVISEGAAYLYAKFLFWPSSPKDETTGLRDHGTTGQ